MSDPMNVKAGEHGVVRVFTTDLEPEGDAAITAQNVQRLLGPDVSLDGRKVEVFPARMIEAMGLTGYLTEGYGVKSEALAGKAAALNALKGLIILIPSSAFDGQDRHDGPQPGAEIRGCLRRGKGSAPRSHVASRVCRGQCFAVRPFARTPQHRPGPVVVDVALGALIAAAALVLYYVF